MYAVSERYLKAYGSRSYKNLTGVTMKIGKNKTDIREVEQQVKRN